MSPSVDGHLDYSFVGRLTPLIQNLQFWLLFLAPISIQNSNLNQLIYKGSTLLQNILSLYKQRMRFIIQDPDSPRVLEEATSTVLVHSVFIDMVCNQFFHCLFSRALVNFTPPPPRLLLVKFYVSIIQYFYHVGMHIQTCFIVMLPWQLRSKLVSI